MGALARSLLSFLFACCANLRPAPLWPEDKGDPAPVPLCLLDSLTPFPRRGCGPGPRGDGGILIKEL